MAGTGAVKWPPAAHAGRLVRSNVGGGLRKVFTDKFCPSHAPSIQGQNFAPDRSGWILRQTRHRKRMSKWQQKKSHSRGVHARRRGWFSGLERGRAHLRKVTQPQDCGPSPAREAPRRAFQCNGCLPCRLAELRTPIRSCVLGETAGSWRVGRRRCGSLRSPTEPPLGDSRSGSA